MPSNFKSVKVENLRINLNNPRYDPRTSEREAIATIIHDQGPKLISLAEDIVDKGLNPSDLPIITSTSDPGIYTVLEGSRRIAALKLLFSRPLIDSLSIAATTKKRLKALAATIDDSLRDVQCVVLSPEDANYWILLKHTGENKGVGTVGWDGRATHRFRGSSPALQAVDLVEASDYLDEETRKKLPGIAITNVERILVTPAARKLLGVDVANRKLILNAPEDQALARLAIVVSEVANRQIKVSGLDTREQRIEYAQRVAASPLPKAISKKPSSTLKGSSAATATSSRRINVYRSTVIPKQFKILISQRRINKIYDELQKLSVDKFVNSAAVLFRVFLELSVDDFGRRKRISYKISPKPSPGKSKASLKPQEMTLRQKLKTAADFLENNNKATKGQLRGIRSLIANRHHVLSVDSLNAYVHNQDYTPTATDLKTSWDNIEIFVEQLWAS
jgi:hypothetical protein